MAGECWRNLHSHHPSSNELAMPMAVTASRPAKPTRVPTE
jgi:hypothetical protein